MVLQYVSKCSHIPFLSFGTIIVFCLLGSHWMSNIITFLMEKDSIDEKPTVQLYNLDLLTAKELAACPSPRILHTHMTPDLLPSDAFKKGRKLILVFRNPKDAAVSFYHFLKKERYTGDGLNISWNCFVDHWIRKSCKWLSKMFYTNRHV